MLPDIFLKNMIQRRQLSIQRAWSDALDLLLICVESGMSIEAALQRVSREIGSQSVPLAEELTLTYAELSYLPDRRKAFENLGKRTGLCHRQVGGDEPHPVRTLRHAARHRRCASSPRKTATCACRRPRRRRPPCRPS